MDIKEKAREGMNGFERVLHKIPGFKGYYEREFRRDADRLQREFVVKQLREGKKSLNRMIEALSRQKNLELLTEVDLFSRSLEKTISEIRYGDGGYSGFFDLIKIKEAELDAVYLIDSEMIDRAGRLNEEFQKAKDLAPSPAQMEPLREQLLQIEALFARRTDLLKGYPSQGA